MDGGRPDPELHHHAPCERHDGGDARDLQLGVQLRGHERSGQRNPVLLPVAATNAYATGRPSSKSNIATPDLGDGNEVVSTNQFTLANSDGATWKPMDANYLTTSLDAGGRLAGHTERQRRPLDGERRVQPGHRHRGLGRSGAGTLSNGSRQPEAWKESGGYAGTFSPNAASVHTILPLKGGSTYTFKLVWKTNKLASGASIFAGGGPGSARPIHRPA